MTAGHDPSDSIGELLMAASRSVRRALGAALAQYDVTPGQARALRVVGELGSARLSVLAERLRIVPRSATEVVDALELRGLVTRMPDPDDRRATCVVTTAEGRRLGLLLAETRARTTGDQFARLSPGDRDELDRILRLLIDSAATAPGPCEASPGGH